MLTVMVYTDVQCIVPCGMFVAISLILSMSTTEIFSESKLWNEWAAITYNMHDVPLLLVFLAIVVYKILLIL